MAKAAVSVFWFRRDLRLTDNHGLLEALKSSSPVLPVFIFDKNILNALVDRKDKRVTFIHRSVRQLSAALVPYHSSLWISHNTPLDAFRKICSSFDLRAVFTNDD